MTTTEYRKVIIGTEEFEKPYDPSCPVCRSPWHLTIDELISEGYAYGAIRRMLSGRKPRCPNAEHMAGHLPHLAEPHRKLRLQLEEAAAERGDTNQGLSLVNVSDATKALIQKGYAALAAGEMEVTSRDLLRAMTLQAQLDRTAASSSVSTEAWQGVFVEMLGLVRHHLSPAAWQAFVADVYASPAIRSVLAETQPAIPAGETS